MRRSAPYTFCMPLFLPKIIADYIDSKNSFCKVYPAPFAVQLIDADDKTVVEPDISVICGRNKLTDRGCAGAPDLDPSIIRFK